MVIDTIKRDYILMENDISRIDSVLSCRFVIENEEIKEIHIVSNGTRSPKQISRDVQSILIATYNLNIDYKKISIAELPGVHINKNGYRLKIENISYEDKGNKATVKVGLNDGTNTFESVQSGLNTGSNIDRMLVKAVLNSVEDALGMEDRFIFEDVKSVNLSSDGIIVVVLVYIINNQETRICGSSLIGTDHKKAVVRATLDALNRCISK